MYAGEYACEWDISVPTGKKVNITIGNFELEAPVPGADCTTVDYLEVMKSFYIPRYLLFFH